MEKKYIYIGWDSEKKENKKKERNSFRFSPSGHFEGRNSIQHTSSRYSSEPESSLSDSIIAALFFRFDIILVNGK